MTDETMDRQTLIGFMVSVGLLILVSAIAILAVRGYGNTNRWVAHTHEVIGELEGLTAALAQTEAARRGFLATGESLYLDERDTALSRLRAHLQSIEKLTVDNATQQRRLRDLAGRLERRTVAIDDMILVAQTQGLPAAQQGLRSEQIRQATVEADSRIKELEREEDRLLNLRRGADDRWAVGLVVTFIVLLLTVTAVLAWLCLRVRTEMGGRTRQAAALSRANTSLETANRELESFSYSVSHDLRSPLRAIDGYSLMLQEDYGKQLDETGRRYIQTIRNGSQRMAALIDDLLTFSRLGRQSLNRQTVDMTALARRAAAEVLEGQTDPKPAVNIPDLPPVPGDPALLRQVWTNLISNAVKYSSKSATPQVQVRAVAEAGKVRFEVQDNGVGFDMRYADKLFGVFQRLHSIDEYPGTGVGLAIVHRIIARHEGAVTAQAERGKGATFGFTLPTEV
jgi:signal transduction histidine kinase